MLCQDAGQTLHDRQSLRQANAELQQKTMHLIDRLGAIAHQRLTQAMQNRQGLLRLGFR
ncbi:hypothetical protein D3C84_928700 [compost metagenome]